MPELPEVETTVRGLRTALTGAVFDHVDQHRPALRLPLPPDLTQRLRGKRIATITRRAKYILMQLDNGETLLLHLGMAGRLVVAHKELAVERGKHDHLVFVFKDGTRLSFNDPRCFGLCDLVAKGELAAHRLLRHIGIEPLEKELTPAWLAARLKGKTASIKDALLDQTIVAGIGNIYACEALFYAGISPRKQAGKCRPAALQALVPAIRKVLNASIKAGGSSLRDYRHVSGELGHFQKQFAVYGNAGEPCKGCDCDLAKTGGVQRIRQGGRSTFYCQVKQR